MKIEIPYQMEGYCKKKKNQAIYAYPCTPCMAYRLVRAGVLSWDDYPDLKKLWDGQMEAIEGSDE